MNKLRNIFRSISCLPFRGMRDFTTVLFCLGIGGILLLTACSEDSSSSVADGVAVSFSLTGIGADVTTRGENLASGTTVRVVAYRGTTYVADQTYTADESGILIPTGGEMRLIEDTYDFYAVSPALAIASNTATGPTFTVDQGVDFAAVKTTQKVTAYSGSSSSDKCSVTLGELARKCAKLTFNVEPGADIPVTVSSLKVVSATLTAMPASLTASGATLNPRSGNNTITVPESAFSSTGNKASGSTVVLPKTSGEFNLTMDIQLNGSTVSATFPAVTIPAMTFDASMNHLFTVQLMKDRVGIWLTTSPVWNGNNQSHDTGGIKPGMPGWDESNQSPEGGGLDPGMPGWDDNDQSHDTGGFLPSLLGYWAGIDYAPELGGSSRLDANGTANCYIVTGSNMTYSFNATVMGNGRTTPAHKVGSISGDMASPAIIPTALTPTSAVVLWETVNTTVAPAGGSVVRDVALANGRVTFRSGTAQGNAVIAVKSGNTILWSWHLWRLNESPKEIGLNAIGTLTTDNELVIMDRNLGALSAATGSDLSTGMLYQWGRKDPMPGSATLASVSAMATTPANIPGLASGGSIATAVANPTTFYTSSSDWCTPRTDNLWGTPLTEKLTINNGERDNVINTNSGMKSIYDPCPVGWRVPPGYAFVNATAAGGTWNRGYSFVIGSMSSYFPASGYWYGMDGALGDVGAGGYYWMSASNANLPTHGSCLDFDDSGYVNPANYSSRGDGISCRCAKE